MNIPGSLRCWLPSSPITDNSASAIGCWECTIHLPGFTRPAMLSRWLNTSWHSSSSYTTSTSWTSRLCWSNILRQAKCFLHGTHTTALCGTRPRVLFFLRDAEVVLFFLNKTLLSVCLSVAVWLCWVSVKLLLKSFFFAASNCSVSVSWSSTSISSSKQGSNK